MKLWFTQSDLKGKGGGPLPLAPKYEYHTHDKYICIFNPLPVGVMVGLWCDNIIHVECVLMMNVLA